MLSAQIPAPMKRELWRLAARHDRSVSAETREALRLHLGLAASDDVDPEPPRAA
jgi:plasmid stability protein